VGIARAKVWVMMPPWGAFLEEYTGLRFLDQRAAFCLPEWIQS